MSGGEQTNSFLNVLLFPRQSQSTAVSVQQLLSLIRYNSGIKSFGVFDTSRMYFLRKLSETHTHSFICQGKNSFQILTFPIFVFTNKVLCSEGVRLRVTDRQTLWRKTSVREIVIKHLSNCTINIGIKTLL